MGRKIEYKKGYKFGMITVIKELEAIRDSNRKTVRILLGRCDCGKVKKFFLCSLKSGHTKSCGCMTKNYIDGVPVSSLKEHKMWSGMKQRCFNEKIPRYKRYGGRGITVCDRWKNSFENFYTDMGKRPSNKHSIDRIDNNGNYEPSNCRWATYKQQANNTSHNVILEYNGKKQNVSQWAKELGLGKATLYARLKYGWDKQRALSEKTHKIK